MQRSEMHTRLTRVPIYNHNILQILAKGEGCSKESLGYLREGRLLMLPHPLRSFQGSQRIGSRGPAYCNPASSASRPLRAANGSVAVAYSNAAP